jgi:signal transduction histidine kinase
MPPRFAAHDTAVQLAERERIFARFVRLDPSGGRPGSGLGLAIARAIARRHGGDLRCDSVERGASFTRVLPAAGG